MVVAYVGHGRVPKVGLHARQQVEVPRSIRPVSGQHHSVRPSMAAAASRKCYVGMDFGTSGARTTVIDDDGDVLADVKTGYGDAAEVDWAEAWERSLHAMLDQLPVSIKARAAGLAFDGTSATAMLVDRRTGRQLARPKLYNESQPAAAVNAAKGIAPKSHTATASTSTLCKLLWWHQERIWQHAVQEEPHVVPGLLHQADWLASLLHGQRDVTDYNNALKLGYDPAAEAYPEWMTSQPWAHLLPSKVVAPGAPVAAITDDAAKHTGLSSACVVAGGTTDSIAAFLAAGVTEPGQAVTSLGSTLAIKLLSNTRVDAASYGIYSHRLGSMWLVGGASNTGGAVLRRYFTDEQLQQLTERMDISKRTGLQYYPLVRPGERFPVNDAHLQPKLDPRPKDDAVFLQGMLEGMADIEARAYTLMHQMGAEPAASEVYTAGGGAVNHKWTQLRQQAIGAPVMVSKHGEASYGAAILARTAAKEWAATHVAH